LNIKANTEPRDQTKRTFPIVLFLVNTTIGSKIAVIEHMCNGRYSNGLPQVTRLKTIADIPANDKKNIETVRHFSFIDFNAKNKPIHDANAIIKLDI
jgi:hypothetical protein